MKRFKFWIVSVCVLLTWIVSFWYCDSVSNITRSNFSLSQWNTFSFDSWTCITTNSYTSVLSFYNNNWTLVDNWLNWTNNLICLDFAWYITSSSTTSRTYYYYTWLDSLWNSSSCPSCPDCPVCDNTSHMGIYQWWSLVQWLDSNTWFYNIYLSDWFDFSVSFHAGNSIPFTIIVVAT